MFFKDIVSNFRAAMLQMDVIPPKLIIGDGRLHRFYVEGDRRSSENGWYVLHEDTIPAGVFGDWKRGLRQKWSSKHLNQMSVSEQVEFQRKMSVSRQLENDTRAFEQQKAAIIARSIYVTCSRAAPNHRYFLQKRIKPYYAHQKDNRLVLPIIDITGNFRSLQYISSNGDKRFLSNGMIKGHFIPIQYRPSPDRAILICEGFATGATLAEIYTDACVIAACNAGNLEDVAINIRKTLPRAELIICADADKVGLEKARIAAKAVNGILRRPIFPESNAMQLTDFNDLYCKQFSREMMA